jgi:hypothetical protein
MHPLFWIRSISDAKAPSSSKQKPFFPLVYVQFPHYHGVSPLVETKLSLASIASMQRRRDRSTQGPLGNKRKETTQGKHVLIDYSRIDGRVWIDLTRFGSWLAAKSSLCVTLTGLMKEELEMAIGTVGAGLAFRCVE